MTIEDTVREKVRDLWNWISLNMVDSNHTPSIRNAQKFLPEFQKQMAQHLNTAYQAGKEAERERVKSVFQQSWKSDPRAKNDKKVVGSDTWYLGYLTAHTILLRKITALTRIRGRRRGVLTPNH